MRKTVLSALLLLVGIALCADATDVFPSSAMETRASVMQLTQAIAPDSVLAHIQALEAFQTRYMYATNNLAVASWIRNEFERFGLTDTELQDFTGPLSMEQYNVIATLPGTDTPDEYVVLGAHYDCIASGDPYVFAPGANDNASGVAALLEIARVMATTGFQPKCSIRFIAFAAEEHGMYGSWLYARQAREQNLILRLMINHDMIGYSNDPDLWLLGIKPYSGAENHSVLAFQQTQQYSTLEPFFGELDFTASDGYPFWAKGYPVVYFHEYEADPHYHTPQDTSDQINPVYCAEAIRASVATAAELSLLLSVPRDFSLMDAGDGQQIDLSWSASTDPDVAAYHLYYHSQASPVFGPVVETGTSCVVAGLSLGVEYTFELAAVDSLGNESYRAIISGTPYLIPQTPANFSETPVPNAIVLAWDANQESDLAGYTLHRSNSADLLGSPVHNAPSQSTSYVDYDVSSQAGYYYYTLRATDQDGNSSAFTSTLSSRPVTLDSGVLIVDETQNSQGQGLYNISDAACDSCYAMLLGDLASSQFDVEAAASLPRLADLGVFSSILWHSNDMAINTYLADVSASLKAYLSYGGNILFSVMQPASILDGESGIGFATGCLGIESVNFRPIASLKYAIPESDGWPLVQVDSLKVPAYFNGHVNRMSVMQPVDGAQILYALGSDYANDQQQGQFNGQPVGLRQDYGPGTSVTLSFPLYYMVTSQTYELVQHVLRDVFGETTAGEDPLQRPSVSLSLDQNRPNPFNPSTLIAYSLPSAGRVRLEVYNLRGQLVNTLVDTDQLAGQHSAVWDGTDASGRSAASGLYLYRLSCGNQAVTRKMLLIK
ncbi:MAG: M20/M25/M40 family metallo-hydrolase [Spirochaetia bacterium]|jgi:hypothetical protein|nr:M20/M25/M40 family metallo-hydrolase [Spirochaetia bacterium]